MRSNAKVNSDELDAGINNPLNTFPGYLLVAVSQRFLSRLSQKLKTLDIRASEGTVLVLIQANPGILQSQIGNKVNIARANMAPLVRSLEEKDLIRKKALDGRSFGLFLTTKGNTKAKKVLGIMNAHEKYIIETVPDRHLDGFLRCLSAMYSSVSQD